ncbi:MAG TPA: membrane protein insertase YidC [Acidobacteriaceae bacterium]|nr:membrane protein insertase YidC [Acidobacteriaceae bacterium]
MAEFKNPNQQGGGGGGQESRTILMFTALFIVILFGMQYLREQKAPKQAATTTTHQRAESTTPSASTPPEQANTQTSGRGTGSYSPNKTAPQPSDVAAQAESTTVVENELYRITFTNRGAQVKSWVLKKYTDNKGKPLDLVNQKAAAKYGYPLSLYTYDAGLRGRLADALYVPSATGDLNAPGSLTFKYSSGGVTVTKLFSFDSSYVIHAKVSVTDNGAPVQALLAWPAGFGDQVTLPDYATGSSAIHTSQGGKADETSYKKISNGNTLHGPLDWAGVSDLYFGAIFLPDKPENADLVTLHDTIDIPKNIDHPNPAQVDHASVLGAAIGNSAGPLSTRLFVGPKALDVLQSIHATSGPSLEKVLNFGWFSVIAKPLFLGMRFLYEHVVPNWGWAILLLTLVINLLMLPTRFQMMKSSLKMQRIQPQMDAIKAKYAKFKSTDPRKRDMQQEMFALQKAEGVNMFGGCLPMLISYPLLYAFYEVLENVIELRHAHWLWLHDLSAPDPIYILPVMVIVSMFLMQYITPSPGMDAAQQKMMAFAMPAIFGFMMLHYGAGLSLYWAGSNFISIGQQVFINRTKMGREMREIALKRAAKKKGAKGAARGGIINARR